MEGGFFKAIIVTNRRSKEFSHNNDWKQDRY